jgi:hypothetical protein
MNDTSEQRVTLTEYGNGLCSSDVLRSTVAYWTYASPKRPKDRPG